VQQAEYVDELELELSIKFKLGKQPWTSYTPRVGFNTKVKARAYQTGEQGKCDLSRLMMGHTASSKAHDGYMGKRIRSTEIQ
jgi:hypothetical protein